MLKFTSIVFGLFAIVQVVQPAESKGKIWAFLAATSNGWINYRHQADLCHAYQLLIDNGISAENIVTMMYDDIAYNDKNPNKGVIINKPGGPNVYKGVAKDYTGQDVTVENFYNILSGNKAVMKGKGTGRVIESGPDDHVFVYIVDHGDTGIFLFLDDEYMYAHNLTQHLRHLKKEKHFKRMLMYVEACKAGSMFDNVLDDNLHVLVSTASATDEFSWARYCDTIGTCLGDYYSTTWMEHMDEIRENWSAKYTSIFKQFKYTRTNVGKSHVNIYGDFRLGFDKVSSFLGDNWVPKKKYLPSELSNSQLDESLVSVKDLPEYDLKSKITKADNEKTKKELENELDTLLQKRAVIDETLEKIIRHMTRDDNEVYNIIVKNTKPLLKEENFLCYEDIITKFNHHCFNTFKNSYVTRHFYKLANLCMEKYDETEFIAALNLHCNSTHRTLDRTL